MADVDIFFNDPHVFAISNDRIVVKFDQTIKVASLTNANFVLSTLGATPTTVPNAFQALNLPNDYNTISRTLTLFFAVPLQSNTQYGLTVSGLFDVAGRTIESGTYTFTTGSVSPVVDAPPPVEPIYIEDHSVASKAFVSTDIITATNPNFYVTYTDPGPDTVNIDSAYNNGRITIKFSAEPNSSYLSSDYFKVQTKPMQRGISRWSDIPNVQVSLDSLNPWIYLDMPALDDGTIYNEPNHTYYITGNKYRVKILRDVGI